MLTGRAQSIHPSTNTISVMNASDYPRTFDEVTQLDLSFIDDKWSADMLRDAMRAVVVAQQLPEISKRELDVWNYLSVYDPPASHGFMFSSDPVVDKVVASMEVGHSGSSMAFTMRHLQRVAQIGVSGYRKGYLDKN